MPVNRPDAMIKCIVDSFQYSVLFVARSPDIDSNESQEMPVQRFRYSSQAHTAKGRGRCVPFDSIRRLRGLPPAVAVRFLNHVLNKIEEALCGKGLALNDKFSVRLSRLEDERLDNGNLLITLAFTIQITVTITYCSRNMHFQTTFANGLEW